MVRRRVGVRWPRWLGSTACLIVIVMGLLWWRPVNIAWRTALVLPHVFPAAAARPLEWVTPEPRREAVSYSPTWPEAAADIYQPGDDAVHGAIIMLLGARPFPRDDPQLVNFASGLARAGVAVMIIDTPNLSYGRITPDEARPLAEAFRFEQNRTGIDPKRIGYVALSVGGSLVLLTCIQDPTVGEQLAFANVFGAYYDAEAMVWVMATGQATDGVTAIDWEPAPLARQIFAGAMIDALSDEIGRDALWRLHVLDDAEAAGDVDELVDDAATVRDLLRATTREQVDALYPILPASIRDRLKALSPSQFIGGLRTPLFVMHDRNDHFVPFTESRRLVANTPPTALRRYTEFDLFEHVNPVKELDPLTFAREIWELFRHLHALFDIVM